MYFFLYSRLKNSSEQVLKEMHHSSLSLSFSTLSVAVWRMLRWWYGSGGVSQQSDKHWLIGPWGIWMQLQKLNILNFDLPIGTSRASFDKVLRWMIQDLTDDKSTLVQVMAWCRQATSHYLSQCWPRSVSPYGVIRPQWVNSLAPERCGSIVTSIFFLNAFYNLYLEHFLWNWSQVAVLHWWEVNNWSGNGRCC